MMKRFLLLSLLCCCFVCPSIAFCHMPALSVDDNEDGTIYIEVGFSNGSSGAGHKIILKEEESGKAIARYTIPKESALTVDIPNVPYTVTFDAGVGHRVTRKGPAAAMTPVIQQQPEQPATLEDLLALAAETIQKIETFQGQIDRLTQQIQEHEAQKAKLHEHIREHVSELDAILQKTEELRSSQE